MDVFSRIKGHAAAAKKKNERARPSRAVVVLSMKVKEIEDVSGWLCLGRGGYSMENDVCGSAQLLVSQTLNPPVRSLATECRLRVMETVNLALSPKLRKSDEEVAA